MRDLIANLRRQANDNWIIKDEFAVVGMIIARVCIRHAVAVLEVYSELS